VLHLEVTSLTRANHCAISINNVEIGTWHLERPRQRLAVTLPAAGLASGLNRLTFRWSESLTLADQPAGHMRRRHISRYGYYPVIARVHQMRLDFGSDETRSEESTGC